MILSINHIQLVAEKDLVIQLRDFYCNVVGLTEGFDPHLNALVFGYILATKMFYISSRLKKVMVAPYKNPHSTMWLLRQITIKTY